MDRLQPEVSPWQMERLLLRELERPIPLMNELRERKRGYGDEIIDTGHELFHEPVVSLDAFGIPNQAYYSRSNAAVAEPIPGVPEGLYVRRSVAAILARINEALADQLFTDFFDGPVELYVEDGWRDPAVQRYVYDVGVPQLLRQSGLSEAEILERRKDIIALPSADPLRPSPHVTGAAVDAMLRYRQTSPRFVEDACVPLGHYDGNTSRSIEPDYFEQIILRTSEGHLAKRLSLIHI